MYSRVASRLQPSPLTWTILTNLERCLKVHFVAQALSSSVCRVTSTILGRGPVKIAKDLWVNLMGTEITALLSATFAHCVALNCKWLPPRLTQIGKEVFLNCVVLQEVVIPTELSDIGNVHSAAVNNCNDLPPWIGVTLNSGCRQSAMPSLCVTNSPRKDPIQTLLTRSYTTSTPNTMPVHERLKVGALASVFRKHP